MHSSSVVGARASRAAFRVALLLPRGAMRTLERLRGASTSAHRGLLCPATDTPAPRAVRGALNEP